MATRVMVIGIGAMGLGIVEVLRKSPEFQVTAIVDRNPNALVKARGFISKETLVTLNADEALKTQPDVLIDATTSILESAFLALKALQNKINVVLMNSEVDQVFGRILAETAQENDVILTSDSGDQYGVLSRLLAEVRMMGFQVVMAGNNKGFLDRYATPDSINHEAEIRRLSNKQCTAYTDGTKLAIEMAITANAENLTVLRKGMVGPKVLDVYDSLNAFDLDSARKIGGVVDYVLGAKPGGSVFTIGYSDDAEERFYMDYYKMGKGPYYLFLRPYHLCHFETPYTLNKILRYKEPILTQRQRNLEVNAYAKTDLKAGTKLDGIGGYHLYGLLESQTGFPIGLSEGITLTQNKKRNEPITWADVKFEQNDPLLELWERQEKNDTHY